MRNNNFVFHLYNDIRETHQNLQEKFRKSSKEAERAV